MIPSLSDIYIYIYTAASETWLLWIDFCTQTASTDYRAKAKYSEKRFKKNFSDAEI